MFCVDIVLLLLTLTHLVEYIKNFLGFSDSFFTLEKTKKCFLQIQATKGWAIDLQIIILVVKYLFKCWL